MRHNVYLVPSVSRVMPARIVGDLLDFLLSHRQHILTPTEATQLFKARSFGGGYVTDIVHRIVTENHHNAYCLLKLPSKVTGVREAVDMAFIPADTLQMIDVTKSHAGIAVLPELQNKLVVNISGMTKASGELSDATQFHARVVRDFLARNYYLAPGDIWLSPPLVRYVARVYSMTIGGQIARLFELSTSMQQFVQTVFCAFFIGQMTTSQVAPSFIKTSARELGLGEVTDILQVLGFTEDKLGHPIPQSLEEVCEVIDAHNNDQMATPKGSRLNRSVLNMRFASLHPDGQVAMTSLEYPPYFLFMILQVLSGQRIGLAFTMKKLNLVTKGHEVMDQVLRQPSLLQSLAV